MESSRHKGNAGKGGGAMAQRARITYTMSDGPLAGQRLVGGIPATLPDGTPVVRFAPVRLAGRTTRPAARIEGRPDLAALVDEYRAAPASRASVSGGPLALTASEIETLARARGAHPDDPGEWFRALGEIEHAGKQGKLAGNQVATVLAGRKIAGILAPAEAAAAASRKARHDDMMRATDGWGN